MKKNFSAWKVLGGLFFVYTISNGIILNTLPAFYPQLMDNFGWNQSEVTRPATLMYMTIAFLAPIVGILLDKFKPNSVIAFGIISLLIALFLYSQVASLQMLTSVYVLFALGLTFGGIVSSMYLITKWFKKHRGLAVGIFLMASSVGGAIFPKIAGWGIQQYDWRVAALIMFGIATVFTLVPLLFLIKNAPTKLGELSDEVEARGQEKNADFEGITLKNAMKMPNFYLLLFVTAILWFCITGVINHQTIYFEKDLQLPKNTVTSILSVFFISSFIGKALFGYLSDKYNKRSMMLLAILNLLLGSTILKYIPLNINFLTFVFGIVYGIGFSGAFTMIQVIIADFYGGVSYGKILGVFTMIDTLAGSAGIGILGKLRAESTSYTTGFDMLIVLCVISALCVIILKKRGE
ncbi:MAG: MFS transporter [Cytophagales bacterium]|nr:MAG: MFS transporter [Cytophagales bacterium]